MTGLSQLDVVPGGTRVYVSVGDDDARAYAGRLPGGASRVTGLFIEHREAAGGDAFPRPFRARAGPVDPAPAPAPQ